MGRTGKEKPPELRNHGLHGGGLRELRFLVLVSGSKKVLFTAMGNIGRNRLGKRLSSTSDTSLGEMSHRKIDMQLEFKSEEKAAASFAIIDVKVKLNSRRWSRNSKEPQHRYSWGEQGKRELQRRPCPPGQQMLSCEPSMAASLLPR